MVAFADTITGNRLDDPFEDLLSRFARLTTDNVVEDPAQEVPEQPIKDQSAKTNGTNGAEWPTSGEQMLEGDSALLRDQTSAVAPDYPMLLLEAAADAGVVSAFVRLADAIDWHQRPAEELVRSVRLSLKAGAHLTARKLALVGAVRFPEHEELVKAARILAPPTARVVKSEQRTNWKGNIEWLQRHRNEYEGQWVALRSGSLVATAGSLAELLAEVDDPGEHGIIVTKVW